jgi:leucyl-tRNA synthetase
MSVPAHDTRDFEFARKYDLPIRVVIQPPDRALDPAKMEVAYDGPGRTVNSDGFDGLESGEAIARMTAEAEKRAIGKGAVTYRLKDWLISRQRYWGTPIPVVYCEKDGIVGVPDDQLPVELPKDAPFTGEGGNPLEKVPTFVQTVCPRCGGPARRETDTMDTFVDSSWYFYRYLSPHRAEGPFDVNAVRYWFPIDLYVGGIEHAILHLVYSRFWTKMMRDLGLVTFDEPVTRLFPQGMVHKDGEVMSKSKGNTVAPDDMIKAYGADTLRLYTLSVAPPEDALEWNDKNVSGVHRFLHRVWGLLDRHAASIRSETRSPVPRSSPRPPVPSGARCTRPSGASPTTSRSASSSTLPSLPSSSSSTRSRTRRRILRRPRSGRSSARRWRRSSSFSAPSPPTSAKRCGSDWAGASASWTGRGRWRTRPSRARTSSSWRFR